MERALIVVEEKVAVGVRGRELTRAVAMVPLLLVSEKRDRHRPSVGPARQEPDFVRVTVPLPFAAAGSSRDL